MKKFEIDVFLHNNKVMVHLGNKEFLEFKNKTNANDYVRKLKKLITKNLYNLNTVYSNTYNAYRSFYFDLDSLTNIKVANNLKNCQDSFDSIFQTYSAGNNNGFKFSSINICFNNLLTSHEILLDYARRFKNYSLINQISSLEDLTLSLEHKFNEDKKELKAPLKNKTILLKKAV